MGIFAVFVRFFRADIVFDFMAGYVCLELSEGRIEERGDQELLLGGRTYPMDYGHDGGLEVIAGEPIKVDSENIGYWKDQI